MLYKINLFHRNLWTKISGFLISILTFSHLTLLSALSGTPIESDWYKCTINYIESYQKFLQILKSNPEKFAFYYEEISKKEKILLKTESPSSQILIEMLHSQDQQKKQIALVNIFIRRIFSKDIIKAIINTYSNEDDYLTKFYFYRSISLLASNQIIDFEDDVLNIIKNENEERVMGIAIPILEKLDPKKTIPIFVEFFKSGSRGMKLFSYVSLKRMGNGYFEEVKKILKQEGAIDALKFIEEAEKGKKPE